MSDSTDSNYMTNMQGDDASISSADLAAAYEQGIADLQNAVVGMTPDQARARPAPGKWSTIEVVSHLSGSDMYFCDRIERTIAMDKPLLVGVDERPYPERLNYQSFDLVEEVNLFTACRKHTSRILKALPADGWKRCGVHTETGLVSVRQLVFQAVRHLKHHIKFIAEKRAALGA